MTDGKLWKILEMFDYLSKLKYEEIFAFEEQMAELPYIAKTYYETGGNAEG